MRQSNPRLRILHSRYIRIMCTILFLTLFAYISALCCALMNPQPSCVKTKMFDSHIAEPCRPSMHDLWVVGAGTLGEIIVNRLHGEESFQSVIAETLADSKSSLFTSLKGVSHRLRESRSQQDKMSARSVVICLPPSSSVDYVSEINNAIDLWAGRSSGGSLIYTSSIGVYGESAGKVVDESSPIDAESASAVRLRAAEEAVLSRGGNVIRLAGLYTSKRGPHAYWLNQVARGNRIVQGYADSLVNLLHYEDAASAVIALLKKPEYTCQTFLACDDEPTSKIDICRFALLSDLYAGGHLPEFSQQSSNVKSKICDSARSRGMLHWAPKYSSFREYMAKFSTKSEL